MNETVTANIQLWREKARLGTLTISEMREAIQAIRKDRVGASGVSEASTTRKATAKAKSIPIDSDALLDSLGELG